MSSRKRSYRDDGIGTAQIGSEGLSTLPSINGSSVTPVLKVLYVGVLWGEGPGKEVQVKVVALLSGGKFPRLEQFVQR